MQDSTILLVTDSDDERDLYSTSLPLYGFRVSCAASLEDLRQVIEDQRPGVLVLNIRLDSDATWARLEEIECGNALNVPAVLVTGSVRPDAANRLRASASGCAAFVATPCTPVALARIVRSVLTGARGLVIMRPEEFEPGARSSSDDAPPD